MIHFSVPSLYAGVYGMDIILDVAQRYYPELRRWSVAEELPNGTRIIEDKQTKERVEIPQFSFALFPGGNPVVVPYDIMVVIAPPNPRIVVPELDTLEQKSKFSVETNDLLQDNVGPKIVVDGPNNEYVYLDHPVDYIHMPRWYSRRESNYGGGERARVQLFEGDTLFAYSYPRLVDNGKASSSGDVDYMPTSRVRDLTEVPAVDMFDLQTPAHLRDWKQIWPDPVGSEMRKKYNARAKEKAAEKEIAEKAKTDPEGTVIVSLRKYAEVSGMDHITAALAFKDGKIDGAYRDEMRGTVYVPIKRGMLNE